MVGAQPLAVGHQQRVSWGAQGPHEAGTSATHRDSPAKDAARRYPSLARAENPLFHRSKHDAATRRRNCSPRPRGAHCQTDPAAEAAPRLPTLVFCLKEVHLGDLCLSRGHLRVAGSSRSPFGAHEAEEARGRSNMALLALRVPSWLACCSPPLRSS